METRIIPNGKARGDAEDPEVSMEKCKWFKQQKREIWERKKMWMAEAEPNGKSKSKKKKKLTKSVKVAKKVLWSLPMKPQRKQMVTRMS